MPRRHRSGRERATPAPRPLGAVMPGWAQVEGHRVQQVTNEREYRCPRCDHVIRPGTPHLVVIPGQDPGGRRHWHTPCWKQELRSRP